MEKTMQKPVRRVSIPVRILLVLLLGAVVGMVVFFIVNKSNAKEPQNGTFVTRDPVRVEKGVGLL